MLESAGVSVSAAPGVLSPRAIAAGAAHFNAWVHTGTAGAVDAVLRAGFASITLDVQHGFITFDRIVECIAAAALAGAPALVRLPLDGYGLAARSLDAGAAGLIAPMIDTVEDARAFADAVKFPPLGRRSWGPNRGMALMGLERDGYLHAANGATVALAMIETERALGNIDAILAVEGIDGVLIGPNDLCVSLTDGETVDPGHASVLAALDVVREATERAGKPAAIFANTPAFAADYIERGFGFIALGPDLAFLQAGAQRVLSDIGAAADSAARGY